MLYISTKFHLISVVRLSSFVKSSCWVPIEKACAKRQKTNGAKSDIESDFVADVFGTFSLQLSLDCFMDPKYLYITNPIFIFVYALYLVWHLDLHSVQLLEFNANGCLSFFSEGMQLIVPILVGRAQQKPWKAVCPSPAFLDLKPFDCLVVVWVYKLAICLFELHSVLHGFTWTKVTMPHAL